MLQSLFLIVIPFPLMSRLRTGPGNPKMSQWANSSKWSDSWGYNNMAPKFKKKLGKLELASFYQASANDVSSVVNFSRLRLRRSKDIIKTFELSLELYLNIFFCFFFNDNIYFVRQYYLIFYCLSLKCIFYCCLGPSTVCDQPICAIKIHFKLK